MSDQWIYAHNWEKWQSGRRQEGAPWIRNYGALLNDDDYLDLNLTDRAVLHGLWMVLGEVGNGRLLRHIARISARLQVDQRSLKRSLDRLNHAGWIRFDCTKNGHAVYTRLEERRIEKSARARATPSKSLEPRPNSAAYEPPDLDLPEHPLTPQEIADRVRSLTP